MPSPHNTLGSEEWLLSGYSMWSENHDYEFKMQNDGKIVVYRQGKFIWQNTKLQRDDVKGVKMQSDGNLVIYTYDGQAVWSSDTWGKQNVVLTIQNDGNLVMYQGNPVWATSSTPTA